MAKIYTYKELMIWKQGIEIAKEVYAICKNLPDDEKFGLSQQLKRSATSISANIAEGWGRKGNKANAQFIRIAIGSANELDTHLFLCKELQFISDEIYLQIEQQITSEIKMMSAFITNLKTYSATQIK